MLSLGPPSGLSRGAERDASHSARRVRASLPAPGRAGAGRSGDHARDRRARGPERGARAQAHAPLAPRRAGQERPRPEGRLPARPARRADQRRRGARLPGGELLLHRVLRPAHGQRAHLCAQRRLLHPLALDGRRPRDAARAAEHNAQRPAPQRAGDGRLDALPTRDLPLEDAVVSTSAKTLQDLTSRQYKYGFVTDIETDTVPRGLNEDVIRLISAKKNEPEFMLEWRLKAFHHWLSMKEPRWQNVRYPPIDYQDIVYYSAPKPKGSGPKSLEEVDPELLKAFGKLGIPLAVQNHPELVKKYLGSVVPYTDNFFATLNSAVFSDGSFCYIPKGVRCPME